MDCKTDIHVKLTGTDGNVYALASKVSHALRAGGYPDLAKEFLSELFKSASYDDALTLMQKYVKVT